MHSPIRFTIIACSNVQCGNVTSQSVHLRPSVYQEKISNESRTSFHSLLDDLCANVRHII